jgi:hypothetical protein
MKRFGTATWNGDLREAKVSVSTESRAPESRPHTYLLQPLRREAGHAPGRAK